MVMLLNASRNSQQSHKKFSDAQIQRFLAAELLTIGRYVKGTPQQKAAASSKILAALMRTNANDIDKVKSGLKEYAMKQAVGLMDPVSGLKTTYPEQKNKSYTSAPAVNPDAKDKVNQTSTYTQKYQQCVERVRVQYPGLDDQAVKRVCDLTTNGVSGDDNGTLGGIAKYASVIPSFIQRDSKIQAFQQGKYQHTPTKNIKSASSRSNPLSAHITNRFLMDDSFRNQMELMNDKEDSRVRAAAVVIHRPKDVVKSDSTPHFIKTQDYTKRKLYGTLD